MYRRLCIWFMMCTCLVLLVGIVNVSAYTVTLNSPAADELIGPEIAGSYPLFAVNVSIDTAVNITLVNITIGGTQVCTNTTLNLTSYYCTWDASATGDGNYSVNASAINSSGISISDINTGIIVDATAPTVSIVSPVNNTNTSDTTPEIGFNMTDALTNDINFSIFVDDSDHGQNGTGLSGFITLLNLSVLTEGTHTVVVQATDDHGNKVNSTPLTIVVDTTAPTSTINAPGNNINTTDTTPELNFTLNDNMDTSLDYVIFVDSAANGQTGAAVNGTPTVIILSALSDGTHTIKVEAADNAGNKVNSTPLTLTVDSVAPTSVISSPDNNSNISDTTPEITFTLTDAVDTSIDYMIFIDGTPNGQTGSAANGTATKLNLSALPEGTHKVIVQGADDAENKVNSTSLSILIDSTSPAVTLTLPTNGSATKHSDIVFEWTAVDSVSVNMTCNVTLNDVVNQSNIVSPNGTAVNTTIIVGLGTHNWSVSCSDGTLIGTSHVYTFSVVEELSPSTSTDTSSGGSIGSWTLKDSKKDCENDWSCMSWSSCENGKQTRECWKVDAGCDKDKDKPDVSQSCSSSISSSTSSDTSSSGPSSSTTSTSQQSEQAIQSSGANAITGGAVTSETVLDSFLLEYVHKHRNAVFAGIVLLAVLLIGVFGFRPKRKTAF